MTRACIDCGGPFDYHGGAYVRCQRCAAQAARDYAKEHPEWRNAPNATDR